MRVLGIDPGYERVGMAVLEKKAGEESLLFSCCFKTSAALPFPQRLLAIGEKTREVIAAHAPDAIAIEKLFFNSNQKTALLVSEARGVVLYEAIRAGLSVYEYTPLQIKMAVVGYGRGTKDQVQAMVGRLLILPTGRASGISSKIITSDDEFDAIAVGLTSLASERIPCV